VRLRPRLTVCGAASVPERMSNLWRIYGYDYE